jgi:aryl-alcohol dehydrogenase-like predicted oxidoreductase
MRYRLLGRTCAKVSEVGFGGWTVGGAFRGRSYGPCDDEEAVQTLREAYRLGCNLFDTADAYGDGHGEELLAKALGSHRKGVLIATKVGYVPGSPAGEQDFRAERILEAVERSLARLSTDWIDLCQLHDPPAAVLEDGRVFEAIETLKASGKIRWAGASLESPETALRAIESGHLETIQVPFHLADRRMLAEVFPAAKRSRVAILARSPLAGGLLTGKYPADSRFPEEDARREIPGETARECHRIAREMEPILNEETPTRAQLALKYVLAFDAIATTLPGIRDREQLEEDLEAAIGEPMSREEFDALQTLLEGRSGQ